jgi:hypothetical protein
VLYGVRMPEMSPAPQDWHGDLATRDAAVHAEVTEDHDDAVLRALRDRLDTLMAELRVARAGLRTREQMVHEQLTLAQDREVVLRELTVALDDRTAELAQAQQALVEVTSTRTWRWSRRAAATVGRLRRLVRR